MLLLPDIFALITSDPVVGLGGMDLSVLRPVLVRAGVIVGLELVRLCEVGSNTAVEATGDTLHALTGLEGALVFVLPNLRLGARNLLLINEDVFSLISVSGPRLLCDDSLGLIGLILGRARVLVCHELIRRGEVSGDSTIETTFGTLAIDILKSRLVIVLPNLRVSTRNLLLINPDVFSFVSIRSSGLLGNNSVSLVRLVLIR